LKADIEEKQRQADAAMATREATVVRERAATQELIRTQAAELAGLQTERAGLATLKEDIEKERSAFRDEKDQSRQETDAKLAEIRRMADAVKEDRAQLEKDNEENRKLLLDIQGQISAMDAREKQHIETMAKPPETPITQALIEQQQDALQEFARKTRAVQEAKEIKGEPRGRKRRASVAHEEADEKSPAPEPTKKRKVPVSIQSYIDENNMGAALQQRIRTMVQAWTARDPDATVDYSKSQTALELSNAKLLIAGVSKDRNQYLREVETRLGREISRVDDPSEKRTRVQAVLINLISARQAYTDIAVRKDFDKLISWAIKLAPKPEPAKAITGQGLAKTGTKYSKKLDPASDPKALKAYIKTLNHKKITAYIKKLSKDDSDQAKKLLKYAKYRLRYLEKIKAGGFTSKLIKK